jgi:hypothetical protein
MCGHLKWKRMFQKKKEGEEYRRNKRLKKERMMIMAVKRRKRSCFAFSGVWEAKLFT